MAQSAAHLRTQSFEKATAFELTAPFDTVTFTGPAVVTSLPGMGCNRRSRHLHKVSGQQVYVGDSCRLTNCTPSVRLISSDANGNPIGGDFGAIEGAGSFATFSTTGSSSPPGISEIFLTGLFF